MSQLLFERRAEVDQPNREEGTKAKEVSCRRSKSSGNILYILGTNKDLSSRDEEVVMSRARSQQVSLRYSVDYKIIAH